jgi:hypothetical protein
MITMANIGKYIRSVGFGGLLLSGFSGILFWYYPALFPANTSLKTTLLIGAFLGAGIQHFLATLVFIPILQPLYNFIRYYLDLVQLVLLKRTIGEQIQRELIQKLTRKYFLDDVYKGQNFNTLEEPKTNSIVRSTQKKIRD